MVKDIHKVGKKVICKVAEVEEILTKVEVTRIQAERLLVLMIELNFLLFLSHVLFLDCDQMANVLFISSSTYSYMSVRFTADFEIMCEVLDAPIHVCIPVGE